MVELVTTASVTDRAFRLWADAIVSQSEFDGRHWRMPGTGLVFSNYGHGGRGVIGDQVMLGVDPERGTGIVKVVRPDPTALDKGRLTVIARDAAGQLLILREGWLKPNRLSGEVRAKFTAFSRISPVTVNVDGNLSDRHWYLVANLSEKPSLILKRTGEFVAACARARGRAGGGKSVATKGAGRSFGLEKGKIVKVIRHGGEAEVVALQGFVWEALAKELGAALTKPGRGGYEVDGLLDQMGILIEIKTGVSPSDLYEAVGQLRLYPSIVGLKSDLARICLIPAEPVISPVLAAAVVEDGAEIHTYTVGGVGQRPKIAFSLDFLKRCRG